MTAATLKLQELTALTKTRISFLYLLLFLSSLLVLCSFFFLLYSSNFLFFVFWCYAVLAGQWLPPLPYSSQTSVFCLHLYWLIGSSLIAYVAHESVLVFLPLVRFPVTLPSRMSLNSTSWWRTWTSPLRFHCFIALTIQRSSMLLFKTFMCYCEIYEEFDYCNDYNDDELTKMISLSSSATW